jgi:predicted ArsR family transcriptional regulator
MSNTSDRILTSLRKSGPQSILSLSKSLGLTKAAIRYQIRQLLVKGFIIANREKMERGLGRPAVRYAYNPTHEPELAKLLINTLIQGMDREDQKILAEKFTLNLLPANIAEGTPKATRINQRIEVLAKLGFIVHWEARANGPAVTIELEPISLLISDTEIVEIILKSLEKEITK